MTHRRLARIFFAAVIAIIISLIPIAQLASTSLVNPAAFLPANIVGAAPQAAALSITPISWDVIGLDSNKVTDGPNIYMVGARVCNTGDAAATNVVVSFVWDTANSYINLASGEQSTLTHSTLAAGSCINSYFRVAVTRNAAAYDTARRYHITASADGLTPVSTPTPRELYVEHLVSQERNNVASITGANSVVVGGIYQYTIVGSTATQGYEQLVFSTAFPNSVFQILSIATTYTSPPNGTNDKEYADACGWNSVPGTANYRACVGPVKYPGGKAGGDMTTVYTVKVIGAGTVSIWPIIYDFSGSSYHYNG
ncbi:MAG TPA: hypothetical protein VF826_01225, partial [Chloroflexia bacterium]